MSVGDGLMALPRHSRSRLAAALDAGILTATSSAATSRTTLGLRNGGEDVLAELDELARMGVSGRAAAAWLRTVERASISASRADLVWSGPPVSGVPARDTKRVFEEVVAVADRSLWGRHFRQPHGGGPDEQHRTRRASPGSDAGGERSQPLPGVDRQPVVAAASSALNLAARET